MLHVVIVVFSFFYGVFLCGEPCVIRSSDNKIALEMHDGLYQTLCGASSCPQSIMEIEKEFTRTTWAFSTYMVANRGRNNPQSGSFSFFESVKKDGADEIFLGHFTEKERRTIKLQQTPMDGALLVEALAWDREKGAYNFYELIGLDGFKAQWFYRGDSFDALRDNQYLHRTPPTGEQKFGERMRCSACHTSGGPIMKELAAPHNDWWRSDLVLPFGEKTTLHAEVQKRVDRLADASQLAGQVIAGMHKLAESANYQTEMRGHSLQEQLRPLFCTTEINLVSSTTRIHRNDATFAMPSSFIINPLLGAASLSFSVGAYRGLLASSGIKFPENDDIDADHVWLAPAVSMHDVLAIETLISNGIISRKHALDILRIDYRHPLFSVERCSLLSLVPEASVQWLADFKAALSRSSNASSTELLRHLDNEQSELEHQQTIRSYVDVLQGNEELAKLFRGLLTIRKKVFTDEISQNRLGQILEPGFRVVFPR